MSVNNLIKNPLNNSIRYKQLDSLRGVAAMSVFLSHYLGAFSPQGTVYTILRTSILGVCFNGHASVIFFFVLSGFVLSLPFINNPQRPLKLVEFYVKRVLRIYPAYVVILIIALCLKFYVFEPQGMASFPLWIKSFWTWGSNSDTTKEIIRAFMLIGPKFNHDLIDPATWSLVVEMKMSLFLPFFILIISKFNFRFNIVLFLILNVMIYNGPMEYLGIFYVGILLAKYRHILIARFEKFNLGILLVMTLVALLLYNSNYEYFKLDPPPGEYLKYFLRDYVIAIGSILIIVIAMAKMRVTSFFEKRPFIFLGDISYSFYLVHMPVLFTVCSIFSNKSMLSLVEIFVTALVVNLLISVLVYNFVEIPFQKLAKSLVKKFSFLSCFDINTSA